MSVSDSLFVESLRRVWRKSKRSVWVFLFLAAGGGVDAAVLSWAAGMTASRLPSTGQLVTLGAAKPILIACSILVVVVAGVTAASFQLSLAVRRTTEVTIRFALGAQKRSVLTAAATEALVTAGLGALAGALFAWWAARGIPLLLVAEDASRLKWTPSTLWLASTILAWCLALVLINVGVVAMTSTTALRPSSPRPELKLRNFAATAQIAMCGMLVAVTIMLRGLADPTNRAPDPNLLRSLSVIRLGPKQLTPAPQLSTEALVAGQGAVNAIPHVLGSSLASSLPTGPSSLEKVTIDRAQGPAAQVVLYVDELPPPLQGPLPRLIHGRLFGFRDRDKSCPVAVVNEIAASEYFGGDALGRLVTTPDGQKYEIVGVVRDSSASPGVESPEATLYFYASQLSSTDLVGHDVTFLTSVPEENGSQLTTQLMVADPAYFNLFGEHVVKGRSFTSADAADACGVTVITESMDKQVFGGAGLGSALIDAKGVRHAIIGVANGPSVGTAADAGPSALLPLAQEPQVNLWLGIKSDAPRRIAQAVPGILRQQPHISVLSPLEPFETYASWHLSAPERIASVLTEWLAGVAFALAAIGVELVLLDNVIISQRDLGIRAAFGASPARLGGLIAARAAAWALYGEAIACAVTCVSVTLLGFGRLDLTSARLGWALLQQAAAIAAMVSAATILPVIRQWSIRPGLALRGA